MSAGTASSGPARAAPEPAGAAAREDWRRGVHAATGVLGPAAWALGPRGGTALLVGVSALAIALELARQRAPFVRRALEAVSGPLFRGAEARGPSGPTFLAIGYALTWLLVPPRAAAAAIVVAALADPAAAVVGRRFGGGAAKSWAGSAACWAVAVAVLLAAGASAPVAAAAGAVAALVERAPWRGADNLLVPLATGVVLARLGSV